MLPFVLKISIDDKPKPAVVALATWCVFIIVELLKKVSCDSVYKNIKRQETSICVMSWSSFYSWRTQLENTSSSRAHRADSHTREESAFTLSTCSTCPSMWSRSLRCNTWDHHVASWLTWAATRKSHINTNKGRRVRFLEELDTTFVTSYRQCLCTVC